VKKVELNLIDKAVAFINPQRAVERLIARKKLTKFEYDAVKYTRERKGPSSLSGAEDYRSNYDRVELMKRARDLAENVGLVRSLLLKFAGHVAGSISYQARTLNPQINSEIEAYWAEWWDKCDISGRHTGSTLMQVAVMSMLRDGDFLFLLARDNDNNLKLQGIEADRLGDPYKTYTSLELIGGIHIDRNTGAPTAYDVFNRSIGDFYTYQATIPSSQAFHLFDPLRIDQYRGISAFHTAINDATDIHELTGFEKMSAKVASTQSAIVKRNNNNASDLSTLSTDEDFNGNQIKLESIESGKISYLEPGEDIVFPNGPSRPSGAFMEFHKVLMRNICLGLGIPYSFAVDPSQMSGPTARLEMQQAGRTFRRYQNLLNDKVLRPVKNIVLADAVARGLISGSEGSKTTKGIFNFGANVSIDLGRESASAIAEFKTGLRTASDIYAERGLDFESSLRQKAQEAALIKSLANEYDIPAVAISDIVESLVYAQQAAQRAGQAQEGADGQPQVVSDISLNGAQVASLINIINAVAAGALSKEGAVSVITAAFPTVSREQAVSIVGGIQEGNIIPTTKEERIASATQQPAQEVKAETIEDKKKEVFQKLTADDVKMLIAGMMGGIELGKYDGIDFTPPEGAREAAKRALDVREKKPASQKGMTAVGIARARDLMNGVKLSPDTVRRMKAFFDRHEVDKKGATWDEQGKGWQAWNGWGGDAGYAWARKVVRQMNSRDKETNFVAGRDCGQDDEGTFGPDNKCAVGYGRPPLGGGYTPKRPGGKFPKDYVRPTPQDRGKKPKPPEPPKPTPPAPKPPPPPPPAKPIEDTRPQAIKDAEKKLRDNGAKVVSLPDSPKFAKEIADNMEELRAKGYSAPEIILHENKPRDRAIAYATVYSKLPTVVFNSKYKDEYLEIKEKNVKSGFLSSTNTLAHEHAHILHFNEIGEKRFTEMRTWTSLSRADTSVNARASRRTALEVSKYAGTEPVEFVSETFAGHVQGKKYSKAVYDLYKKLGGPELK
jgi:lambda family phage portal protein